MYYIGSKRQLSNPEKWPQFGQSGHGNKGPQMHCFFTCKRAKSCLPTLWLYSQKFRLLWQTLNWQKISIWNCEKTCYLNFFTISNGYFFDNFIFYFLSKLKDKHCWKVKICKFAKGCFWLFPFCRNRRNHFRPWP